MYRFSEIVSLEKWTFWGKDFFQSRSLIVCERFYFDFLRKCCGQFGISLVLPVSAEMVPQQNMDSGRSDSPINNNTINNNHNNPNNRVPQFGSQLVDENSATPYSDATQVGFVECLPSLLIFAKSPTQPPPRK